MLEISAVEQSIGSLLLNRGYVATGIPIEPAPYENDAIYPAIIYKPISSKDVETVNGIVVMATLVYQVVAMAEGWNIGPVVSLASAIHRSLHQQSFSCADGIVYTIIRDRVISIPYRTPSGKQFQMLGGWYRFNVRSVY